LGSAKFVAFNPRTLIVIAENGLSHLEDQFFSLRSIAYSHRESN